jgi:hypothetical protein
MTRALALTAAALALASCTKENARGRASFWLYDCDSAAGSSCDGQQLAAPAVISSEASRLGPEGVCVLVQSTRVTGVTVVLELDAAPGQTTVAVYSEWSQGQRTFDGVAAGGKVLLDGANRTRGRFALRFVDAGPDGVRGTPDDLVRVLADGQFYLVTQTAPADGPTAELDLGGDSEIDLDFGDWGAPVPSGGGTDEGGGGCGGDPGPSGGADESGGCGGDTGGDSSVDTSGCDGDSGGEAGCDGDTGGGDLSGCGDAAGGCEGDLSHAAKKHASRARGAARFGPVFALAFAQALGRKRRKAARD